MGVLEELISQGLFVNIKRSSGKIHEAKVTGHDEMNNTLTVEWDEDGETKGKTLDLDLILQLNSILKSKLSSDSSAAAETRQLNNPVTGESQVFDHIEFISAPSNDLQSSVRASQRKSQGAGFAKTTASKSDLTARSVARPNSSRRNAGDSKNRSRTKPIPPKSRSNATIPTEANLRQTAPATSTTSITRASECVRQVEKLAQNRLDRRQRMDQARQHEKKLQNIDPGNPNWKYLAMISDFRETNPSRPLSMSDVPRSYQINVCVRKRPLNKKELAKRDLDVLTITRKNTLYVHEPKQKVDLTKYVDHLGFRFDYVFEDSSSNEMVYKFTAQPLLETIFESGFATCFAYGQTGSGKTHTMGGEFSSGSNQDETRGIYAFVARDVFKMMSKPKYKKDNSLQIFCSFFEIYSGKLFDLLKKKNRLKVMEDASNEVNIVGLTEKNVTNVEQVLECIQLGNKVRTSGQTSANQHSSRSHAVFQIILRRKGVKGVYGKFSLIDLAGNERGADTMSSDRQTRMESAEINKSLLALKECIRALGRKNAAHLPFRGSKLTQVLRDSFIGQNSKTCMIAMISPGMSCCENTLNTLRYANRVKELAVSAPVDDMDDLIESSSHVINAAANDEAVVDVVGNGKTSADFTTDFSPTPINSLDTPRLSSNGAAAGDESLIDDFDEPGLSEEMCSYHNTWSQLNDMEEQVHEEHKNLISKWDSVGKNLRHVYNLTNEVDYDMERYSEQLEEILNKIELWSSNLKLKVAKYRDEMLMEEKLSQTIKSKSSHRGGRRV